MAEMTINQTLANGYDESLWYDWFCSDKSLERRGKSLFSKVKAIAKSTKFD
ncbi:MAG: hypothetical protein IKW14_05585 [Phascolarctobacterium sp.]|nr:hypothetical protein [Phascolarctobacterium sp.]